MLATFISTNKKIEFTLLSQVSIQC